MFGFLDKIDRKHMGIFAAGILFGTAGIKILSSKDAKKVYTHGTAAALRAGKGFLHEDSGDGAGKCGGHLCGGRPDQ